MIPRPSTAFVLGLLSGLLAAVTVLPTVVPLTWQLAAAEDRGELQLVSFSADLLALTPTVGEAERLFASHGATGAWIADPAGTVRWQSTQLPGDWTPVQGCLSSESSYGHHPLPDGRVAWSCRRTDDQIVGVIIPTQRRAYGQVGGFVLGLAIMVGISTSLGVLQVLSPLSEIADAVRRVGKGQRGVTAPVVGLAELDELSARVNGAARAMEDREDAILSRIQLVQQLARMVAHEIRNPLQSLELLTSLIASEDNPAERELLAASIHGEIRTLESVVQRMLRDAPGQAALLPTRSDTNVVDLVRSVHTFKRFEAERAGVTLEMGPVVDCTIGIDRALVRRALENLIANAMAVLPPTGGRVRLSAMRGVDDLIITVDDNGPGVASDLGNLIYQANFTTRADGHGLGLALVQGVMLAHDGTVTHERSDLGGARFVCRLPFASEEPKDKSRANPGGG